jgi:hypothetical protein
MSTPCPAPSPTPRLLATLRLLAGLWLFAAGVALGLRSGLGVSPWDVFHDGIRHTTPLSFGAATILIGVVLVALTTLAGVKPGPGTLTNMVGISAPLARYPSCAHASWPPHAKLAAILPRSPAPTTSRWSWEVRLDSRRWCRALRRR